ncbi:MAG: polysulfide reductase NrfD [Nocardioidaceae bacterium]|nr:polysulfide reductase NrfD [Nocardioidaceae bacterium]
MRYGFAIDQRTCIGCHACTVACKTEHQVPVGQFRTWVKYVDQGDYPSTTRDFAVMRCNHCTDAPCVKVCPTSSLFTRDDGIVDFDGDRCIGCKACMQACPYDAIYIDADTHTAAKCNYCAHRVDQGLEPACVVVCPTESIWVGDLDDPSSALVQLLSTNETAVRAPEQNTGPNVFYLGADRAVLEPLDAPPDGTYLWSEPDAHRREVAADLAVDPVTRAKTTLNTAHPRPWGWRVTTYLWTKAVGSGALMIAALALLLRVDLASIGTVVAPLVALVGTAVTGVLLVWDLKRPERFLYIFLKPNPTSWLFWGSVVLATYAGLAALWLVAGLLGQESLIAVLAAPTALAGLMTAAYTGLLFGQAEGRDLWQSPLLFWHLVVQAVMVGAGAMVLCVPFIDVSSSGRRLLVGALAIGTVAHLAMLAMEYARTHRTRGAAAAARMITHGRYARTFWGAVVVAAVAAVAAAVDWGMAASGPAYAAALLVQPALLAYESVFVRAGQDVPLS